MQDYLGNIFNYIFTLLGCTSRKYIYLEVYFNLVDKIKTNAA